MVASGQKQALVIGVITGAGTGFPWGCVAHHAAIAAGAAGGLDDAATLFDEAEAIHVRLGAAFMAERTRIERARMGV